MYVLTKLDHEVDIYCVALREKNNRTDDSRRASAKRAQLLRCAHFYHHHRHAAELSFQPFNAPGQNRTSAELTFVHRIASFFLFASHSFLYFGSAWLVLDDGDVMAIWFAAAWRINVRKVDFDFDLLALAKSQFLSLTLQAKHTNTRYQLFGCFNNIIFFTSS